MSDFKLVKLIGNPISLNINIVPRGAYSAIVTYVVGDSVSYLGSSYVASQTTLGNLPTNTTFWQLLAAGSVGGGVTSFNTRTGAVVSVAGDYTASDITNVPSGNISSVTVQAAVNELQGDIDTLNTNKVKVAQDAVGNILVDSSTIDFTYNNIAPSITAIVIDGSITDAKVASGIDAAKINTGVVSNVEFNYLDGVTSAIQTQINGKANTSHVHALSDITQSGATSNQVPTWNGTNWVPANQDVTSVNTYTGAVVLTKSDIGLGNADNTSDINKPISTATQTALNLKLDIANFVPAGTNKQVQFNDNGAFGGSEIYYDKINERVGVQVTAPTVPLHVDSNIPQNVALPSGISHTLTLDPSVDSPVSYSISEVTVPDGTPSAIGFSQLDDPSYGFLADASVSINVTIYPYKIINGTNYYSGTSNITVTDNNDSQTCGFNYTWTTIGGIDGYTLVSSGSASQGNPNWTIDVGNTSSYFDNGASSSNTSTPTPFSSICFPYQPTTGYSDPNSGSASFSYDGSGQMSNGSDWQVYIYGYVNIYGQNYYSATPYLIDLGTDPNDGNAYAANGSFSGGTYPNYVAILVIGGVVAGQDLGGGSSFYITTQTSTTVTPQLVSYSGTTWSNSAYGKITSPSTKYSITHNDQSITDSNPVTGYIFLNTFATFGNATNLKVIAGAPSARNNGYIYDGSIVGSFYQINTSLGDPIVTPSTIGFLATGQTQNYDFYAKLNVYGADTYSPTAVTEVVTYPNDSQYYVVTFAGTLPSGATLKIHKVSVGFAEHSDYSFQDDTTFSWSGSSTITPNSAYSPTAFIDWDSRNLTSTNTTPIQIRDHNTGLVPRIVMAAYYGGVGQLQAGWGYSANHNFVFDSYNHGLEIGVLGTPDYIFTPTQAIFNNNITSNINLVFKGGGGNTVLTANSNINTLQLGYVNYNYDTFSAMSIQPYNSDAGLIFYPNPSAPTSVYQWAVQNSSASVMSSVNSIGHMSVGGVAASTDSNLYIGAGNSAVAQIKFQSTFSLPSGAVPYGLSAMSDKLWFSDSAATYRSLLTSLATATAGYYWYSDGTGSPVATADLRVIAGSLLIANTLFEAKQGIVLDSGQNLQLNGSGQLQLGSTTKIAGQITLNYVAKTANYTLGTADHCVNATSGTFAFTLPTAVGITGRKYVIKNSGTGTITINTTSSQTIDQFSSGGITLAQWGVKTVMSNGANWILI